MPDSGKNQESGMKSGITRLEAVNDFVVKFANVNGSGSASANELFAKAILRMGVPVSPRNIFPSNIQGLPTWYEVRVTESGWLGRRGGVDLMVAMNPQTWNSDLKEIEPGGYLFYDNSKPLPASKFRDDINVIGMPLTEICNSTYTDPRQRQLFKNIIYIGALSALLDMDAGAIAELIGEQYKGKEKLLKPNLNALQLGREYAKQHLEHPIGLRVQKADAVGNKIFVDGNSAAALGCVYGGASVCAWYPITPSSSLAEAFERYCSKLRIDKASGKNKYAAQLDRFMFNIQVTYPSPAEEIEIVKNTTSNTTEKLEPILHADEVLQLQTLVRGVPVANDVVAYAVALTGFSRPETVAKKTDEVHRFIRYGASPRASQYLILGAKARALLLGRFHVDFEDVISMAGPVLRHRLVLNFHARAEGIDTDEIIRRILKLVRPK